MERQLFKVVEIKRKGLGCVALQDIKSGSIIFKEKFQFKPRLDIEKGPKMIVPTIVDTFFTMTEEDQREISDEFGYLPKTQNS